MGSGGGMDGEASCIADVGELKEEFQIVHNCGALLGSAFDTEDDHSALAIRQVLLRQRVGRVARQTGIAHPGDFRMGGQELGDLSGVLRMAGNAQREGLDALQEHPGGVWRERRTLVAQCDSAQAGREGHRPQRGPYDAVVAAVRLVEERELLVGPVEIACVDRDAADAGAMSANPFGEGVDDHVCAVADGVQEGGSGKGGVHNQGQVVLLGDFGIPIEVSDIEGGIADGLDEDGAGLVVNGRLGGGEVIDFHEFGVDVVALGQNHVELRIGATVEIRGRDQILAGGDDVGHREVDRGGAR